MIRGIDISSHQGVIDWNTVANDPQKIMMVSTKITGGDAYVNPTALNNADGMWQNGLFRDFYHYAFEGEWPGKGPKAEADWFLSHLPEIRPTDTVSLDLEEGYGPLGDWALEWLNYVSSQLGFDACLYSSEGFMNAHMMTGVVKLGKYPLWLAAWRATLPAAPPPWEVIAFWQDSADGHVQGISGHVDMDWFNGTADQRKLYGFKRVHDPNPVPTTNTWAVGSGIREMMTADGTVPLTDSDWIKDGTIEWGIGQNDVQYFWHVPSGHHWRVHPS